MSSTDAIVRNLRSGQQGTKAGNDVVNKIRHLMDRFNQRLTLANLRLAERYLEMELHLLVEFGIRGGNEKFIACLERLARLSDFATRIVLKRSPELNQNAQGRRIMRLSPEVRQTVKTLLAVRWNLIVLRTAFVTS